MRVFLTSPWIPAEWVRAHGLEARGIWFADQFRPGALPLAAGVCAFAESVVRFAETQPDSAVVFTTACDQLRRGFDAATFREPARAFLFNLPATQTPVARQDLSAPSWNGWVNFFWPWAAPHQRRKFCGRKWRKAMKPAADCAKPRSRPPRGRTPNPWRDFTATAVFPRRRCLIQLRRPARTRRRTVVRDGLEFVRHD